MRFLSTPALRFLSPRIFPFVSDLESIQWSPLHRATGRDQVCAEKGRIVSFPSPSKAALSGKPGIFFTALGARQLGVVSKPLVGAQ